MSNPVYSVLKRIYGIFSRYPMVARLRESYRKNIQMRYWPWYRRKPRKPGTDPSARYKHELIVSLTSFPARIHLVHFAIYSLMRQSLKPNRIVLWLGEDKFPNKEDDLPKELIELQSLGLEIRWCQDVRAATKLVPSIRAWPEAIIVTADDDLHYPRHWLQSLYQAYEADPGAIQAGAIESITFDANGNPRPFSSWTWNPQNAVAAYHHTQVAGFGALYPPHCLHPDVLDTEAFLRISPSNDDFWFWAHALRHGTKIHLVQENRQQPFADPRTKQTPSLWAQNFSGGGNDRCFANLLEAYPELDTLMKK